MKRLHIYSTNSFRHLFDSLRHWIAIFCLLAAFVCTMPVRAQFSINDYIMTTGTNPDLWIELDNALCGDQYINTPLDIGFDFYFMGKFFSNFIIGPHGDIHLDTIMDTPNTSFPLSSDNYIYTPTIVPYGKRNWLDNSTSICHATIGNPGNRTLVVTFDVAPYPSQTPHNVFQLQLNEDDGSILFIYQPRDDANSYIDPNCGFALNNNSIHWVSLTNHTHQFGYNNNSDMVEWPTGYRYYRFTPEGLPPCPMTYNTQVSEITATSARVTWDPSPEARSYRVHYYALNDSAATAQTLTVSQNTYTIENLRSYTQYRVSVRVVCHDGGFSIPSGANFYTVCWSYVNNPIKFAELTAPYVTCRIGTFNEPSTVEQIIDMGPDNIYSRHTVFTDPNKWDPHTGNALKIVPDGYCRVVRLGSYAAGAQQEEISYEILVDTNNFDLLLLHYAVVEQNPNHVAVEQPRFSISITDSIGNILNNCNERNFVAGVNSTNSNWNVYQEDLNVYNWHDWDAMGMVLSEYHGQRIYININNFDCSERGHFGYGYFMLQGTTKRFTSNACGEFDTITYTAPFGFNYRWYEGSNPSVTLSTEQSYTVTHPGNYYCRASFIGTGTDCGFTMFTTADPRYPYASISYNTLSDCGNKIQFFNNSCIANDPLHTQLTNQRCDSITWFFGDGHSSIQNNPIHTFAPGDYQVMLIASLADGKCNDTATVLIHVEFPSDTMTRYFCPGSMYQYNGIYFSDTGYYYFDSACFRQVLHLCYYPTYNDTIADAFCLGGSYSFRNLTFTQPGEYPFVSPDVRGCDSTLLLILSVYVNDSSSFNEVICEGSNFIFNNQQYNNTGTYIDTLHTAFGCDSLSILHLDVRPSPTLLYSDSITCGIVPYYILQLEDSPFSYAISSTPIDSCFQHLPDSNLVYLYPHDNTVYHFTLQYPDEPYCTTVEDRRFDSLGAVQVTLKFYPEALSLDQLDFRAVDEGAFVRYREWIVDSTLLDETGPIIFGEADPKHEQVRVTLIGHNINCTDTATGVIPILRHTIFFPNIFTPSAASNNIFRPIYTNITNYQLWIYDRRGDLVFYSANPDQGWDGTHEGIPVPQGAYVYNCRYDTPTAGFQTATGAVTLVR